VHVYDRNIPDQPENLELIGYNLNVPLRDPELFQNSKFDLIHSRFVFPGIRRRRWATYLRDMRPLLRRGGWVQIMEWLPLVQSNNGRLTDQSAVRRWWYHYSNAMERMDRDPRIGSRLGQLLNDNSYRDVAVDIEQIHIGGWSDGMLLLTYFVLLYWLTWELNTLALAVHEPSLRGDLSLFHVDADTLCVDPVKASLSRGAVPVPVRKLSFERHKTCANHHLRD
jgi:hypothetical protein